jgi:hypothetical protein
LEQLIAEQFGIAFKFIFESMKQAPALKTTIYNTFTADGAQYSHGNLAKKWSNIKY